MADLKKKYTRMKRFELKKFELRASMGGYDAGTVISLECRIGNGSPKSKYWRKRLKEAVIDGNIVPVAQAKAKKVVEVVKCKDTSGDDKKTK